MYDGDSAGQRETLKAMRVLQDEGLEPLIVTLPNESDPDEFVQKHGKEEFLKFVQNNRFTAIEYKLENLVKPGITLPWERKLQVLDSLFPDVEKSESLLTREKLYSLLAMKMQLSERDVEKEFAAWRRRHNSDGSIRNRNSTFRNNRKYAENSGNACFEEKLLVKMANSPELCDRVKNEIGFDFFNNTSAKGIASIFNESGGDGEHREVLSRIKEALLQEHEMEKFWARACLLEEEEPLTEQAVEEFFRTQKVLRERSRWQYFAAEVKELESNGDFYSALTSIVKLGKMTADARKEGRHEN
ncbi:MAG: toprim domain-containing protein [Acidobacteriota bacterium]